ncbi:putative sulfate exporter family transporter [Flavobacterium sp. NG2]|nr:putative sulfate exporter family transporter [Flavobacterium sp. NG2]WPR73267.1 putative sulfate exporter family transporter [Flavobacterium sp. NG2]
MLTLFSFLESNKTVQKIFFILLLLTCVFAKVSPPVALLLGLVVANLSGHPFLPFNHIAIRYLLQFSVVGLGFGMNALNALAIGSTSFLFTISSIVATIGFGYLIGRWLSIEKKTSHLISCGTAICGGSAIAAIAPIIKSDEKQTSVALGVIFILNSIALFLFPSVGHWLSLTQQEFGLWCAIAIHDTSSVVGAANKFGHEALEVATTVKLARALWIIPVALLTTILFKNKSSKIKIPYFIGFFILAMLLNTYLPEIALFAPKIVVVAKVGLTITLFLIGSGLNFNVLRSVGFKPLLQGVLLWFFIAALALVSIMCFT